MGNALPKNPFQKHQEKVVSEELIEENLDPKEFPQNHKGQGVNGKNSIMLWDCEKVKDPLKPNDEVCDAHCTSYYHHGRNCLVCRRSYIYHSDHRCPKTEARGDFSLAHQTNCDTFCDGVHFGVSCLICGKMFKDHFEGHWCDEKLSQYGNFATNFTTIKRAIG